MSFPGDSDGKKSTCSARHQGSVPGWERSPGERTGYPLHYSWDSLMAQTVKNLPTVWETWVQSLGWEDALEEGMATHSIFLPGNSPTTEEPGRLCPWGRKESDTTERLRTYCNSIVFCWFCTTCPCKNQLISTRRVLSFLKSTLGSFCRLKKRTEIAFL